MYNMIAGLLGAAVITAGTIGGTTFVNNVRDNGVNNNQPVKVQESVIKKDLSNVKSEDENIKTIAEVKNSDNTNYNHNSANNPSKDVYQDMVKIMRDNGFKDAARYMQTGDYDAMTDYMNDISQEDYDKMIEIMRENGYGYMADMMESVGREDMIEMHNSMHGSGMGSMMGGF